MNLVTFATILLVPKLTIQDDMLKVLHLASFHSSFAPEKRGTAGIARIINFVNRQKDAYPSTIFIDTMDWFTGTIWFSVHRANICTAFYNILPADVVALGHEELNFGKTDRERTQNFTDFIVSIKDKTILCANCDIRESSPLHDIIKKSVVLDVKSSPLTVGVTAFIRSSLVWPFSDGTMTFTDELEAIQKEVKQMLQDGVKTIIVVAHAQSSYIKSFTKKLKDVDLVIGGHTHQLLYNGKPPSGDTAAGEYPLVVTGKDGTAIPIVYCGCYGAYVGELNLYFDENGKATEWSGNPVYMGSDLEEDKAAVTLLEQFRPAVDAEKRHVLGRSRVYLNHSCYWQECNFGSFVADALVDYAATQYESSSRYWTDKSIALVRGKYFSSGIAPESEDNYTITVADLMSAVVTYENLFAITVNGSVLRQAMEYAVSDDDDETTPRFLQVSGLHVVYDMEKDVNKRVIKLKARCAACEIPAYEDVEDTKEYKLIMVYVLTNGYANFSMLKAVSDTRENLGINDIAVLKRYITAQQVIQPGKDERIIVLGRKDLKLRALDTSGVIKYRTHYLSYAFCMFSFAIFVER